MADATLVGCDAAPLAPCQSVEASRASLVVFAQDTRSVRHFMARVSSFGNLEFPRAHPGVGGFFAALVFAISVVAVPMMLDRNTDGIVAGHTA